MSQDQKEYTEIDADYTAQNSTLGNVIFTWNAPEFEIYEKSGRWYLIMASLLAALIIYAIITNSPIMAITFILIGIVGYLQLQKDPENITFHITTTGILAGRQFYKYENISSFWIFYEPPYHKVISLHISAKIIPHNHLPIGDEDPVKIREILMEYIPEIKQEPSTIDILERFFNI